MNLAATIQTYLSTTNLYQLDNSHYMLSNSGKNLNLKLNYEGLPLERALNELPESHIKLVRWAQIQISAGKMESTWLI